MIITSEASRLHDFQNVRSPQRKPTRWSRKFRHSRPCEAYATAAPTIRTVRPLGGKDSEHDARAFVSTVHALHQRERAAEHRNVPPRVRSWPNELLPLDEQTSFAAKTCREWSTWASLMPRMVLWFINVRLWADGREGANQFKLCIMFVL